MKSSYAIHEAKARFSELVRVARAGRELVITDRGRPVARLIGMGEPTRLADRLLDLQSQGVLTAFPEASSADIRPVARRRGALARFLADR
jgi:prevent-host-death family protein